jgi:DNA-binding beta-propeller fold protein YncE
MVLAKARAAPQTIPPSCSTYAVHLSGSTDSQFFWLDLNSAAVVPVGPLYARYDIEALDLHPQTGVLYAIAGAAGNQDGNVYTLDKATGALTLIGNTGTGSTDGIVSASFHPDGTLWVFQANVGLHTVDLITGDATLVWPSNGSNTRWAGLAWDIGGQYLYGSQGNNLYRWDPNGPTVTRMCGNGFMPSARGALDFRSDGQLIGARDMQSGHLSLFEADFAACTTSATQYATPYNELGSLGFEACNLPASLTGFL